MEVLRLDAIKQCHVSNQIVSESLSILGSVIVIDSRAMEVLRLDAIKQCHVSNQIVSESLSILGSVIVIDSRAMEVLRLDAIKQCHVSNQIVSESLSILGSVIVIDSRAMEVLRLDVIKQCQVINQIVSESLSILGSVIVIDSRAMEVLSQALTSSRVWTLKYIKNHRDTNGSGDPQVVFESLSILGSVIVIDSRAMEVLSQALTSSRVWTLKYIKNHRDTNGSGDPQVVFESLSILGSVIVIDSRAMEVLSQALTSSRVWTLKYIKNHRDTNGSDRSLTSKHSRERLILPGEVRPKKPSPTLNLETNGLKVTSEPLPMAGQAGCLQ
ncbi:hypothetical protein J6590_002271 [Homalodisca vitripennis]|nr:hypothetical protein J6590_002271 [Homalodisca vitripennis]